MYDKGWLTEYGDTYYIGSDGIMKTRWFTLNQIGYYYFNVNTGAMVKGRYSIDKKTYFFDVEGICINRDPLESNGRAHYILVANDLELKNYIAVDAELSHITATGYKTDYSKHSLDSKKVYGYLPYAEIVFLHGHGAPGLTMITDNDSTTCLYYTYNFDDPEHYKDKWLNNSSSRNISDYVDGTLSDVKFFYFLSCYSATREHHQNELYSVDKSCLGTVIEKGAQSGLGYRYQVSGAEYYGNVLARKLSEGYSVGDAIASANTEYEKKNGYIVTAIGGFNEYQSPHDPRNQVIMGNRDTVLKTNNQRSIAAVDSRLIYDTARGGEKDMLGSTVHYVGTSKELVSSSYVVLNMDDICMTDIVYQNDTEEITVDSEGRLIGYEDRTVSVLDEVTDPKTEEEIAKIVEAYLAKKLPEERCKVSEVSLTDLGYSVIIHSENADISYIHVMANEDGKLRSFIVHYDDSISVTEKEKVRVKEQVEQYVEERYPNLKYTYNLRYRMVAKQRVAQVYVSVVNAEGFYIPFEVMIGIE